MKYCESCEQNVQGTKKFNWIFFLLTCWFGIGIVYLIWYLMKGKDLCPMCGCKLQ